MAQTPSIWRLTVGGARAAVGRVAQTPSRGKVARVAIGRVAQTPSPAPARVGAIPITTVHRSFAGEPLVFHGQKLGLRGHLLAVPATVKFLRLAVLGGTTEQALRAERRANSRSVWPVPGIRALGNFPRSSVTGGFGGIAWST